jgi:hypothetical protein
MDLKQTFLASAPHHLRAVRLRAAATLAAFTPVITARIAGSLAPGHHGDHYRSRPRHRQPDCPRARRNKIGLGNN